jgi:hypothetical protein
MQIDAWVGIINHTRRPGETRGSETSNQPKYETIRGEQKRLQLVWSKESSRTDRVREAMSANKQICV